MFAWHGKNLVELDSFFWKNNNFFSKVQKKRPLKWPHFGAFLSWVVCGMQNVVKSKRRPFLCVLGVI